MSNRRYVTGLVLCLAGSVLTLALAWPFYQEKYLPPPRKTSASEMLTETAYPIDAAVLDGPDKLQWSPLLQVQVWDKASNEAIAVFDGMERPAWRLEQDAAQKRELWHKTRPEQPFPGLAALQCDRRVRWSQLLPYLQALRRAGHENLQLAFLRTERVERPLFGRFPNRLASAAYVRLVTALAPGSRVFDVEELDRSKLPYGGTLGLRLSSGSRYGALARAVVAARQRGNQVLIEVGSAE